MELLKPFKKIEEVATRLKGILGKWKNSCEFVNYERPDLSKLEKVKANLTSVLEEIVY